VTGTAAAGALGRELWPADLVYDGLGTPRRDAAVVVQVRPEPARVVAIGAADELRRAYPDASERPKVAVLAPPPVNAHTHLDLSDLPLTPGTYAAFVRTVVAHGRAGGRGLAAAERGLAALRAAGVTTVGDVVTDEAVLARLLADRDLNGVAYWEVLGPDPDEAEARFEAVRAVVARHRPRERPGGVRLGLSPHTPHTVSAPLLQRLARFAQEQRLPMQIHVAEDPGEVALHAHGGGPLREALGPFLAAFRPSGATPVGYLEALGVLAARPTLIHAVHVDDDDVRRLQRAGCAVVHCPRSNELLQCGTFPWARFARFGVTVGLGTDSLGSSPSLSPVDEWGAARAVHGAAADPAQLVWAAVKGGHRALGGVAPRVVRGSEAAGLRAWPTPAPWPPPEHAAGSRTADDVRGAPS
jgi:cytosine/adenosine deaminase-related metal-dependent hydrolase